MTHSLERPLCVLGVLAAVAAWATTAFGWLDLPWWLLLYGSESVLAGAATVLDKRAAGKSRARFSELGLHLLELLGGFPGALLAQRLARHKTRKASYRFVFWLIVALHAVAWGWYLSIP